MATGPTWSVCKIMNALHGIHPTKGYPVATSDTGDYIFNYLSGGGVLANRLMDLVIGNIFTEYFV